MSDIFISYASPDRPRAQVLAEALKAQGWSVWWDRNIPAGTRFAQVIAGVFNRFGGLDREPCYTLLPDSASSGW
jgi:hypothetical protein